MSADDELTYVDGDTRPFAAAAYPVTRVFCDKRGIICYERDGTDPIQLNAISPRRSRDEAKRRLFALLDSEKNEKRRELPISSSGCGLTYNQLKLQTIDAFFRSQEIEGKLKDEIDGKRTRRKRGRG